MSPRGRRPAGSPDAREAILAAARTAFARDGYRTSLRGVARDAGVDPALVHHYFRDRAELFAEAVVASAAGTGVDISGRVQAISRLAPEELGEGIARSFVGLWDGLGGDRFSAVIRAAMSDDESLAPFRDFIATGILGGIMDRLDPDRPELRGQLIASQLIGFGAARWMARLDEVASLSVEEAVALIAPTIQRYATGDLPSSAA
ncbi:TetR family transcriptional regulator [Actinomyces timonensis]|uniref:TetR family transcriptional regulator n=1 Tax=Actinomyces timonensis TaxID=1288391 RepID=A0AAU8N784_9ACTO